MKRIALLSLAAVLCTGIVVAQEMKKDDHMKGNTKMMITSGMVTKVDESGKMMMMKDGNGKEMMINWDGSTKVTGKMAEGSMAKVEYMMKDGKMMAHSVMMSEKPKM